MINTIKCPVCGMEFDTKEEHDKHRREAHEEAGRQMEGMKCPVCGYMAESKEDMEQHGRTHEAG